MNNVQQYFQSLIWDNGLPCAGLSFAKTLSGANVFEISDIQGAETGRCQPGDQKVTGFHWGETR
jgi:hypothetical protein